MRYPTRAFQSDTTVVSNDRRRHHRVSQTKAAPAPTGAAFTYPLDRSAYISGSRRGLHLTTVATCGFRCCLTPLADGSVSRTASFPTTSATWQPSDPGDLAQCDCGAIGTEKMSIKIESRW